jgi:ssDNA-binding Zn-finger/Zn-ribbon topoisomerase 1
MNILIVVVLIFIVVGILAALKMKLPSTVESLSFESRDTLFTPAERSFLGVLEQSLDSRYRVFGKVRLGDIVKPAKGLSNSKRTTAMNRINQKHVDFVVCSAADLAVIGVVELDDQSHGREDRAGRDEFVDLSLACAKIPVARFTAKKGYAIQEIRTMLVEEFKLPAEPPTPSSSMADSSASQETPQTSTVKINTQPEDIAPVCPKCSAGMVKRQAAKGPHAGKFFWACSTFPKCRQVVEVGQAG